jgi:hypothetical protein
VAALFAGSSRRRIAVLFDRHKFLELAEGESPLPERLSVSIDAVVLGVISLRKDGEVYQGETLTIRDASYSSILRRMAGAMANQDRIKSVKWGGREKYVAPREWGHYWGIRRRGQEAKGRLQAALGLSNERMNKLVELLWRTATLLPEADRAKLGYGPENALD